jgi:4-hydroxybenzoate polyprenyltransferase
VTTIKPLIKTLKFLTSTSIILGLNASMVVAFANFLYGSQTPLESFEAAFLITFAIYHLNKFTDVKEDSINKPESTVRRSSYYIVPSIGALLVSLTIGVAEGPFHFGILVTPVIIGVVYSVKFVRAVPRLKEVVGVKSVAVALSWALTGALLPVTHSVAFEKVLLVFVYVFVQMLVNTILFDTLDVRGDSVSGVKTIPVVLGLTKTRKLMTAINSTLLLWLAYCLIRGFFVNFVPALTFGVFYGYLVIWYFLRKDCRLIRLQAELMVDGEWLPILAFVRLILR